MQRQNSGPTDHTTPCDKCGGGTYTFPSGSVWCPSEDCTPGGHFIKRVAFERPPNRDHVTRPTFSKQPVRKPAVKAPVAAVGNGPVTKVKPIENDGFDSGFDGFIEK